MSVLSPLAPHPDSRREDTFHVVVIEGEEYGGFNGIDAADVDQQVPRQRYLAPRLRRESDEIGWYNPLLPYEPYIPTEARSNGDSIGFVVRATSLDEIRRTEGGRFGLRDDWATAYLDLQEELIHAIDSVKKTCPVGCFQRDGVYLAPRETLDIFLSCDWATEAEAMTEIQGLKSAAKRNLGMLSWMTQNFGWWRDTASDRVRTFVSSLQLPGRRTRGCLINLLADWSSVNFAQFLEHGIPFAYVWSTAVAGQERFARANLALIREYLEARRRAGREPVLEDCMTVRERESTMLAFDYLFQDSRKRVRDSTPLEYDASKKYRLQLHEGWKPLPIEHESTIRRCLEKYESFEVLTGEEGRVLIQAWSLRETPKHPLGATIEIGPVATQPMSNDNAGGRATMTLAQRRELYKMSCAPYYGQTYLFDGDQLDLVDDRQPYALRELERQALPGQPKDDEFGPSSVDRTAVIFRTLTGGGEPPAARRQEGRGRSSRRQSQAPALLKRMSDFPEDGRWTEDELDSSSRRRGQPSRESTISSSGGSAFRPFSVSPRLARRQPIEAASDAVLLDPSKNRYAEDITSSSPAEWSLLTRQFHSQILLVAGVMCPRPYPRGDDPRLHLTWNEEFIERGYVVLPRVEDRLRVRAAIEARAIWDGAEAVSFLAIAGIRFFPAMLVADGTSVRSLEEAGGPPSYDDAFAIYELGGLTIWALYLSRLREFCQRPHAPCFFYYGGIISYMVLKYGGPTFLKRLGQGISKTARIYKKNLFHAFGSLGSEMVADEPSKEEIDILHGRFTTKDGRNVWLLPPPTVWQAEWPGNGEWHAEEERYFDRLTDKLENGEGDVLTEFQWAKTLRARSYGMIKDDITRAKSDSMDNLIYEWEKYANFAYCGDGRVRRISSLAPSEIVRRLRPL